MTNCVKSVLWVSLLLSASVSVSSAQGGSSLSGDRVDANLQTANLQARDWFRNAKFGLFIHWGVYSVPAAGEWVMENRHIPIAEYEKFAPQFNPQAFSAKEIVSLAKSAGMRYITITSKHHDGFAMFATKQTKWNIVDATPYARDPLKELADECHRQGIKLFFYYSQLDWHNPDYWPLGQTGHAAGRSEGGDFNRYLDFMDAQLTELLTGYGEIAGIWFDGMWDKPGAVWRLQRTYALIHKLQPAALVGSNHHQKPIDGEDFQMFEQDLPGENTAGFNQTYISDLPLEMSMTLNGAWGYNKDDKNFKSVPKLIQSLVRAAGANANLLLNIGPTESGTVIPEFSQRLQAVGGWLLQNGETIYGTREGPISPRNWGVTTQKVGVVYLHILDWPDEYLALPFVQGVKGAHLYHGNAPLKLAALDGGLVLKVPKENRDPVDTIVVLER